MSDPRTAIVQAGYDAMAERYLGWGPTIGEPRERMLDALLERLEPGARVLELGCGAGIPVTRRLAERHTVTGVDISEAQLRLAREHVPGARAGGSVRPRRPARARLPACKLRRDRRLLRARARSPRAPCRALHSVCRVAGPGRVAAHLARRGRHPRPDRALARGRHVLLKPRRRHQPPVARAGRLHAHRRPGRAARSSR
jgi:SAM-dependent methyltransferase